LFVDFDIGSFRVLPGYPLRSKHMTAMRGVTAASRLASGCLLLAENANHVWVDTRGRKVDLLCERKAIMPLR
jgi:hypothetical protein